MSDEFDQRVTRAVKRRNRKIAARYPMFADQFATTPEAERDRLASIFAESQRSAAEHARFWEEMWAEGEELRGIVAAAVDEGTLKALDDRYQRALGHITVGQGTFYADYWWHQVREYAPEWAQKHCPNKKYHKARVWGVGGRCCTCGAVVHDWAAEMPVQMGLSEAPNCRKVLREVPE